MKRKISSRERTMLIVMIIIAVLWIGYVYGVEPLMNKRNELKTELDLSVKQLETVKDTLAQEPALDASIEESYRMIDAEAVKYFNTTPQEEYILLLNDLFLSPEIEDSSLGFLGPQIREFGGLKIQDDAISVSFTGNYEGMMNLFRTIWSFSKKIQITNLQVNGNQDMINANANLNLYTFAVDTNVVDGLYKWYQDDLFHKENPFIPYRVNNQPVRYLYMKEDSELFNYDKYSQFIDIGGHWMEDEIEVFLEQGYLYLNPYLEFRPDESMTRGEFVVLLDSVYSWPIIEGEVDLTSFRDYEALGSFESSFARAIYKGYLSGIIEGYEDNTLRPQDPIRYEEVELIMDRIKETTDFDWDDVAESIRQTKGIERLEWNDKNNPVTRAEAVYLLYYMK